MPGCWRPPAQPLRKHLFPAQPADLTSFLWQQLSRVLPPSPCSASCSFPGPHPQRPPVYPTSSRHWQGLSRPPVAWPFLSLFGALPKSAMTSTLSSFSLAQGDHCPPHKGGPSVFTLWRRKDVYPGESSAPLHVARSAPLCVTCRPSVHLSQAHITGAESRPAGHRTGRRAQERPTGSEQDQDRPTGGLHLQNQLYVYLYPLSWISLSPTPHPTPLGHQGTPG